MSLKWNETQGCKHQPSSAKTCNFYISSRCW